MARPRFHTHFTPTSASWLNAVEGWFSQLERRALQRGTFTNVAELCEAIRAFRGRLIDEMLPIATDPFGNRTNHVQHQ